MTVAPGLRHAAEGVLRAGAALHAEDTELLTLHHPAVAVRRHESAALGAEDDGADRLLGHGLDEPVGREARQPLNALRLENAGYEIQALHVLPPRWCVVARGWA